MGCLLGHAMGDALGLPREGLSRRRAARRFGAGRLEHALFFGRGMVSDDTEHHCMVAQALLASRGDPARFERSLAWRLRGWLAGLPAGVGFATLRACLKLWLGVPPRHSGVRSAGNGAAMRAPILGAFLAAAPLEQLDRFVGAATRLTHTDPRAEQGARIVARAARRATLDGADVEAGAVLEEAILVAEAADLRAALERVAQGLAAGESPQAVADALGLERGVTGFVVHTVPLALACWLHHRDDLPAALSATIALGGDTDTVAAIVGGLAGAALGPDAVPERWRRGLLEWPRSASWIAALGARLSELEPTTHTAWLARPLPLFWPGLVPRNLWFTAVVLAHGLRRLLPPY